MLNREQRFFLSVLADYLHGRETMPIAELDWKAVYGLASHHSLSALVYAQCGAFLPAEAEVAFLQDYGKAVADYAARKKIANDIDREFTLQKIPFVLVKGLAVAECYPDPELRTMGDIDVIVKTEDKERAHGLLLELGFKSESKGIWEWRYWKDSCQIELHHRLLYEGGANTPAALLLADRLWQFVRPVNGSSRCELSPEFHFLFLVMHLKKHLIFYSAGFRQIMDLAVAAQKWSIDWSQTEKWLSEVGLLSFFKWWMSLCQKEFKLELPFKADKLPLEFAEESVQRILRNGVFGSDDEVNTENNIIGVMVAGGGDCLSWCLQICWKELLARLAGKRFPTALFSEDDALRKSKTYSFVNRRPWLFPFAWGYRLWHCTCFKVLLVCKIMLFGRKKMQERRENLREMGL